MMKMRKSRTWVPMLLTAALVGGGVMLSGASAQEKAAPLRVGTYQPQEVFSNSGPGKALMEQMEQMQSQMQQAQESGDQQKLMQIQMQAQQQQQDAVQAFQQAVQQAVPSVAEDQGVQVVAVEVTYTAPGVETQDLTPKLIEQVQQIENGEATPQQQNQAPNLPGMGQ